MPDQVWPTPSTIRGKSLAIPRWLMDPVIDSQQAFLDMNGEMTELGIPFGTRNSGATAINSSGQIVGNGRATSIQRNFSGQHAILWSNGTATDLGTLPGDSYSDATSINDSGVIVGESFTDASKPQEGHAFVYENGVMTDLNSLLPANSGYVLNTATEIDNADEICGLATYKNQIHGYVLYSVRLTNANADTNSTDSDTHSDADTNSDTDTHADTDAHADPIPHTDTYGPNPNPPGTGVHATKTVLTAQPETRDFRSTGHLDRHRQESQPRRWDTHRRRHLLGRHDHAGYGDPSPRQGEPQDLEFAPRPRHDPGGLRREPGLRCQHARPS